MFDNNDALTTYDTDFDVAVIGAGSAGFSAAITAADNVGSSA